MLTTLFVLFGALFLLAKGASFATRYAVALAEDFRLSRYTIGFIVVAVVSILPETLVVIQSSAHEIPSLALGMLFGSNIADLTLIFGILVLVARRALHVESKILKNHIVYPLILLVPILLGLNGNFSRIEGLTLIIAGGVFYYLALRDGTDDTVPSPKKPARGYLKNGFLFAASIVPLFIGSYFTVEASTALAEILGVSAVLVGILFVGLGTTLPELSFSLRAVKHHDDSLAVGDLLGTVLADTTIVLGMLALLSPFSFPKEIVLVTGTFMALSSGILFYFMKTDHRITAKEGVLLILLWVLFVVLSFFANT